MSEDFLEKHSEELHNFLHLIILDSINEDKKYIVESTIIMHTILPLRRFCQESCNERKKR